jgi:peptidoglycan/xylan/chitin deacetylase (PgdA/CDA1 family)
MGGAAAVIGGAAVFGAPMGIAVPGAALLAILADGIFRPASSTLYPTISSGPRDSTMVALTFDDGPDAEVTPGVLDTLGEFGARATFFTIGRNVADNRCVANRIVAEGHELANHSWQHSRYQNFYSRGTQAEDLSRSSAQIREITGVDAEPLYRPPIGLKSPPLARAAHERNLTMIGWSVHGRDTMQSDAPRIAGDILKGIAPGDIVLLHDGHDLPNRHRRAGADALPLILRGLRDKGLQAVTVSELLGRGHAGPHPNPLPRGEGADR